MAGRPRGLKVKRLRFEAVVGSKRQVFTSHALALRWLADNARPGRPTSIQTVYSRVYDWAPVLMWNGEPYLAQWGPVSTLTDLTLEMRPFSKSGQDETALCNEVRQTREAEFDAVLDLVPLDAFWDLARELDARDRETATFVIQRRRIEANRTRASSLLAERRARQDERGLGCTVRKAVTDWISRREATSAVRPRTAEGYRVQTRSGLAVKVGVVGDQREFGDFFVGQLTSVILRRWFTAFAGADPKPAAQTIRNAYSIIRAALKEELRALGGGHGSVDWALVDSMLPAKTRSSRRFQSFTDAQVAKLISAATIDPLDAALVALALSGIRCPSELCAARWDDIELDESGCSWYAVQRSAYDSKGQTCVHSATKTGPADRRQVPLAARQAGLIREVAGASEWVLGQGRTPMSTRRAQERFQMIMDRAGIKGDGLSINSCRHTTLTALKMLQLPNSHDIARLVGHASQGRDTIDLHYDRASIEQVRARLRVEPGTTVADRLPWWLTIQNAP